MDDTIWLFETPRHAWADDGLGIEWDAENECLVNADADADGDEVSFDQAVAIGAMDQYFETSTVFATEADAKNWGRWKAYNYPDGWQVRSVPIVWGPASPHPGRTHEVLQREGTRDPIFLGQRRHALSDETERWETERVFLTRQDGNTWRQARPGAARAKDRIYCVPATWNLCDLLAARTVGGRYS